MKKYEILITLPGTLDDNEVKSGMEEIKSLLGGYNADLKVEDLGKIRLAYPIKQIRYGYFYTVIIEVEPQQITEISEKFRLRNDLLRFIISVHDPKAKPVASVAVKKEEPKKAVSEEKTTVKPVEETVEETKKEEVVEKTEEKPKEEPKKEKTVDLEDIDKKLDEILESNVIPGV